MAKTKRAVGGVTADNPYTQTGNFESTAYTLYPAFDRCMAERGQLKLQ